MECKECKMYKHQSTLQEISTPQQQCGMYEPQTYLNYDRPNRAKLSISKQNKNKWKRINAKCSRTNQTCKRSAPQKHRNLAECMGHQSIPNYDHDKQRKIINFQEKSIQKNLNECKIYKNQPTRDNAKHTQLVITPNRAKIYIKIINKSASKTQFSTVVSELRCSIQQHKLCQI